MSESFLVKLRLTAPLYYAKAACLEPFAWALRGETRHGEQLFCFELESSQCQSIEPNPELLLGPMLFAAQQAVSQQSVAHNETSIVLPAGNYLFTQRREVLDRGGCLALAVEQQKDGLWERLKPAALLYVRYLFEDGSSVTQLLRPFNE